MVCFVALVHFFHLEYVAILLGKVLIADVLVLEKNFVSFKSEVIANKMGDSVKIYDQVVLLGLKSLQPILFLVVICFGLFLM